MNIVLPALDDTKSETAIVPRDKSWPDDVRPFSVVAKSDACARYGSTCFIDDQTLDSDKPDVLRNNEVPEAQTFTDRNDDLRCVRRARHARVERAWERKLAIVTSDGVEPEQVLARSDEPQRRCLMGASFGAVASLSTAYRYPGFYGRLLLQSGSFAFTDIGDHNHRGPLFDPIVQMINRYRAEPTVLSEKIYVSVGQYESLIYENRSIVPLLQSTGMDVKYEEARDGHNWENWRDRLRSGLSWIFPGPLWMVYE